MDMDTKREYILPEYKTVIIGCTKCGECYELEEEDIPEVLDRGIMLCESCDDGYYMRLGDALTWGV